MVRVGGGWDTLEHYLDKHDPCRCSAYGELVLPLFIIYYNLLTTFDSFDIKSFFFGYLE